MSRLNSFLRRGYPKRRCKRWSSLKVKYVCTWVSHCTKGRPQWQLICVFSPFSLWIFTSWRLCKNSPRGFMLLIDKRVGTSAVMTCILNETLSLPTGKCIMVTPADFVVPMPKWHLVPYDGSISGERPVYEQYARCWSSLSLLPRAASKSAITSLNIPANLLGKFSVISW